MRGKKAKGAEKFAYYKVWPTRNGLFDKNAKYRLLRFKNGFKVNPAILEVGPLGYGRIPVSKPKHK